jgi:hypothetical protein
MARPALVGRSLQVVPRLLPHPPIIGRWRLIFGRWIDGHVSGPTPARGGWECIAACTGRQGHTPSHVQAADGGPALVGRCLEVVPRLLLHPPIIGRLRPIIGRWIKGHVTGSTLARGGWERIAACTGEKCTLSAMHRAQMARLHSWDEACKSCPGCYFTHRSSVGSDRSSVGGLRGTCQAPHRPGEVGSV